MMPLALAPAGTPLRLEAIRGGLRLRQRLADLGLTPGVVVRLVQNDPSGPLILALRDDARLALGRGMAAQVMVIEEGPDAPDRRSIHDPVATSPALKRGVAGDTVDCGAALDAAHMTMGGHR